MHTVINWKIIKQPCSSWALFLRKQHEHMEQTLGRCRTSEAADLGLNSNLPLPGCVTCGKFLTQKILPLFSHQSRGSSMYYHVCVSIKRDDECKAPRIVSDASRCPS